MEQQFEVEGDVLAWVVHADVHVKLLLAENQSKMIVLIETIP